MTDVTAAGAIVHGLADLLQAGRLALLRSLPAAERCRRLSAASSFFGTHALHAVPLAGFFAGR